MAASSARERQHPQPLMSIGQVLEQLQPDFPTLSPSKLRFLEAQGLVTPHRTRSGYRKFSLSDVDRIRMILTLQRDRYMPLSVIRERLDGSDDDPNAGARIISAVPQRYRRDDLIQRTGARPQLLSDAISSGLIGAADFYDEHALSMLQSLTVLDRHGIEPRHLRALRQSATRDAALIESALAPLMRRKDDQSRRDARQSAEELSSGIEDVRLRLVRAMLIERMQ